MDLVTSKVVNNTNTILNFMPRVLVLFLILSLLRSYNCVSHITFVVSGLFEGFKLSNGSFVPLLITANYNIPKVVTSHAVRRSHSHGVAIVAANFVPYNTGVPVINVVTNTLFSNDTLITISTCFVNVNTMVMDKVVLGGAGTFSNGPTPFIVRLPTCRPPILSGALETA